MRWKEKLSEANEKLRAECLGVKINHQDYSATSVSVKSNTIFALPKIFLMGATKQLLSEGLCPATGAFGHGWRDWENTAPSSCCSIVWSVCLQSHLELQNLHLCYQVETRLSPLKRKNFKKMQYVVMKEDTAVWLQNCLCEVWEELKKPLSALEQSS